MAKKKTFIARHVLEVRHSKKSFNFLDYHGELVDYLLDATGYEKIKVDKSGARIEVVSKDLKETFFVSFENFGLQLEAIEDFKTFKDQSLKLLKIIDGFAKYHLRKVVRIGTESTIFVNIPSRAEEGIRQIYFNKLFANKANFERKTGLKVTDIAQLYLDTDNDGIKTNITTGPTNFNEVINRFFVKAGLYDTFGGKNGVFYKIDAYSENLKETGLEILSNQIIKQIDLISNSYEGYSSLFNEKTK
jgi:hypothetical protein